MNFVYFLAVDWLYLIGTLPSLTTTIGAPIMGQSVLIIDDDEKLNNLLKTYLTKYEFKVQSVTHPDSGLKQLRRQQPDIIILDVMLPDKNGFEVCKEIRKDFTIPIIMLTARGEVTDKVVGLELGADDYLAKPFEPRELVARIQSILRRSHPGNGSSTMIKSKHLILDLTKQAAKLNKKTLDLTTMEFELLAILMKSPGRVFNRDQLLDKIRGLEWEAFNRSIDVLMSRLRQKLNDDPKKPRFIKTIRGSGYSFIDEVN